MSVDLRKLIAKKSYLVTIKASEICEKLLEELRKDDYWLIKATRPKSATFALDYKEKYAYISVALEGKPMIEMNFALKRAEFESNALKCYALVHQTSLNEIPTELMYIVLEERIDGCIVKAICKPMLYFKIIRHVPYPESDLQNIRIESEEFLDHIFIGGLGAKEIQEKVEESRFELLINDVNNHLMTERIYEMLKDATTCVLLMGWVGTDCLPKFKELKTAGITIRAVTHNPNERKAPVDPDIQKSYSELVDILGLENVSVNRSLHGRALIVDNKALIGSMDLNSDSLSGEHIEFAIYTEDVDIVRSLRAYFEKMFKPLKEK